jgi:putative CocE/NonD family hydrolase
MVVHRTGEAKRSPGYLKIYAEMGSRSNPGKNFIRMTMAMILSSFCLTSSPCLAQEASRPVYQVIEELGVKVTMRDGIRLSTDIYRPDAPGKFPGLLLRTPYGNGGMGDRDGHFYTQRGYVVVIQDTRGRYDSEGDFDPMQHEGPDGYDTQQWMGEQSWCNGKIGTFGGSYNGFTQWMPAQYGSPYLKTMFPSKTFSDFYREAYVGGAFRILRWSPWSYEMSRPAIIERSFVQNITDSAYRATPFIEQDKLLGWRIPFLRDWLAHPERDLYWRRSCVGSHYSAIRTSVYHLGGWFDSFQQGTLDNFIRMTSPDIDPEIRARQKLLMGPWIHGSESRLTGDMDFGEDADVDTRDLALRWFDNQLKGIDNGIMQEPPVRIFVMGENAWRYENEWPLSRTVFRKYYFHSSGNANTSRGDGTLDTSPPEDENPDAFVYDPENPVITPGRDEPIDQRAVEARNDVLVYTTGALAESIEVTGPVEVVLYASSSATNTDFTAKLVDVHPDGKAIRLCEGIIRASFRNPDAAPSAIQPDRVYRYNIPLWSTSNLFKEGHQIRVEISSSNFPRFDRNLNTGIIPALETTSQNAKQTIHHGREYPSCIVLPVIE